MSSSSRTSKRRKAKQSQTLTSSKNHHQNRQQEEQSREKNHNRITITHLPTQIVTEILSRLTIKTLFNCRLVYKSWAALISTPEFAQVHLSRSRTSCLIKPINRKRQSKRLHLIDPESSGSRLTKLVFIPKVNIPNVPLGLINSCNGLVCLCQLIGSNYPNYACNIFVCNPLLKEYVTLPKPPHDTKYCGEDCIFGFSYRTNQYKVVLRYCSTSSSGNNQTFIYRLGEGSWKNIESAPYSICNNCFDAFLNGSIHWIGSGFHSPCICCFDFVNEQFRAVPEPSEFDEVERYNMRRMHVGVIKGNLSVCDFHCWFDDGVVIWVMKDYGVKESWSKDFVITPIVLGYGNHWNTYMPIMIMGNGLIQIIFNKDSIMLYNPKIEAFQCELKIFGVSSEFQAIGHVPSLISLKDIAIGENLKVLGRN